MSFSGDTKNDLCALRVKNPCCRRSMLYGMLLFSGQYSKERLRLITENERTAREFLRLLSDCFGIRGQFSVYEKKSYSVSVEDPAALAALRRFYGNGEGASGTAEDAADPIHEAVFRCPDCFRHFARGAFLSGGTVSSPVNGYRLDISAPARNGALAARFCALLAEDAAAGIPAKHTLRKKSCVVYFKESESIEDFLTFIGAQRSALAMMNVTIYKEIRNQENRRSNCDTANIYKATGTAAKQLRAIRRLQETGRFESLDPPLKETALLRERLPESTLSELAAAHIPPLTKSGVNHRLQKLLLLAGEES